MTAITELTFKLTSQGIHLLRNKFTYQLIPYNEVESANLIRGKSIKNWMVVLIIGLASLTLASIITYHLIDGLSVSEKPVRFYNMIGNGFIAVLVLVGLGIIAIISAFKSVPILEIDVNNNTYKLRVIKNPDKLEELLEFLILNKIEVKRGDL
ncbi:hypothetical protein [uncultured Cyclobacterium sp.]|uniref:hypothetical protein n=1 Tax=uncultured Cyclobacterium sp. TaxID=453820 RepID=UPI0030EEFDF7